jgi:hypothetical protein
MRLALTILLTAAATSHAQTNGTYLLTSTNVVSPSSPSTTIEVWGTWADPGGELRFVSGSYDLAANEGLFSSPTNVLLGPGSSTGIIAGNTVTGATNGQILISIPGPVIDNPILLATYDWTTTNFTPRTVDLQTSNTTTFLLGDWRTGGFIELVPNNFTPGTAVITVVPAPAAWLVLALPLVASRSRR